MIEYKNSKFDTNCPRCHKEITIELLKDEGNEYYIGWKLEPKECDCIDNIFDDPGKIEYLESINRTVLAYIYHMETQQYRNLN
jgi:hypothetical protein